MSVSKVRGEEKWIHTQKRKISVSHEQHLNWGGRRITYHYTLWIHEGCPPFKTIRTLNFTILKWFDIFISYSFLISHKHGYWDIAWSQLKVYKVINLIFQHLMVHISLQSSSWKYPQRLCQMNGGTAHQTHKNAKWQTVFTPRYACPWLSFITTHCAVSE